MSPRHAPSATPQDAIKPSPSAKGPLVVTPVAICLLDLSHFVTAAANAILATPVGKEYGTTKSAFDVIAGHLLT